MVFIAHLVCCNMDENRLEFVCLELNLQEIACRAHGLPSRQATVVPGEVAHPSTALLMFLSLVFFPCSMVGWEIFIVRIANTIEKKFVTVQTPIHHLSAHRLLRKMDFFAHEQTSVFHLFFLLHACSYPFLHSEFPRQKKHVAQLGLERDAPQSGEWRGKFPTGGSMEIWEFLELSSHLSRQVCFQGLFTCFELFINLKLPVHSTSHFSILRLYRVFSVKVIMKYSEILKK